MIKLNPKDIKAIEIDKKFLFHVFHIKAVHFYFKQLFENDNVVRLLEKIAKQFFLEINEILLHYLILELCKITDPAINKTANRENFTVANIIESINWSPSTKKELLKIKKDIDSFRKYIIKARNRLLAHYDKDVVLSGKVLGSFNEDAEVKIIGALEKVANLIHKECTGKIYGNLLVTGSGDVFDFIKSMRKAIAFDKIFEESTGEKLLKLDRYLQDTENI